MPRTRIREYNVAKLWCLCRDGIFAVPEIQREFVWDSKRAYKLLDSIHRCLPIGSLLVWETRKEHRHLLRQAQEVLPPHDGRNPKTWFLIDGQQRLSVLHRAKSGGEVRNSNGRVLDFSKLCFSFDDRYDTRFVFVGRPSPGLHIPLPELLCDDWKRCLRGLSRWKRRHASRCRKIIRGYKVPVIFVETPRLEDIREAFLRINSGGLRISTADRAFTRASRLNLRRLVTELRRILPRGFDSIDPGILQSAMALIVGQKELGSKAVESAIAKLEREGIRDGRVSRHFTQRWHNIDQCIRKAVDYIISELRVPDFGYLPSDNMVAVLAYFFHENARRQPTAHQRREIRKWFWATGVGRRYAGRGYYASIRSDIAFFQRLGHTRHGQFAYRDKVFADELRRSDYKVASSLNTAFQLLLLQREPRYLDTGNRIPINEPASSANRKDRHHIFPRALLVDRNRLSVRDANSLCNICFVVAEENQSIGSKKPIDYLAPFKRLRHFASVMDSHLIPHRSESALWERNVRRAYRTFQRQRLEVICRAFEKSAGIRLFRKE